MKNDIGLGIAIVLGGSSFIYFNGVYYYGELYDWTKHTYALFGLMYGFAMGAALAYHWTINYLK